MTSNSSPSSLELAANATMTIPKGWTNDEKALHYENYWRDSDSGGQFMAREYGLNPPKPIMCMAPPSGECLCMFQSDTKYYFWNEIQCAVLEIIKPTNLKDIMSTMAKDIKLLETIELDGPSTPDGWTNDEEKLDYQYYWSNCDSSGQAMARDYGLKSPQPIMCSATLSNNHLYMFQSGTKYYIWNLTEGAVMEIVEPTSLRDITSTMAKGLARLDMRRLEAGSK